jgi:hypothetical protein
MLDETSIQQTSGKTGAMDKLSELEQRIKEYKQQSLKAEKIALQKLTKYPPYNRPLSAVDVLRRELFRHHTRTLLLNELQQWIAELKGMRLYQLCAIPDGISRETEVYGVRQYMTEKEAEEVNATFKANRERLRWRSADSSGEEKA